MSGLKKFAVLLIIIASVAIVMTFLGKDNIAISEQIPDEKCPDVSKVAEIKLQCPQRKDGKSVPCDIPVTLKIPYAYLTNDARHGRIGPTAYALYDSLKPACTQFKGASLFVVGPNWLMLHFDRYTDADVIINDQIERAKHKDVWKLVKDSRYPTYDHYSAYMDPKLDNSILVPNDQLLNVPHVITCMGLRSEENKSPKGNCVLYTNYRGELLVKTIFEAEHLKEITEVYRKTNELIDRFSEKTKRDLKQ